MNSSDHKGSTGARCLAALGLMLFMAACTHNAEPEITASMPVDYRDRHPIRLVDGQRSLQIFVGSVRSGLTPTQRAQVVSLGSDWRREGTGYILVETPAGAVNSGAARQTVHEIRSLLRFAGVPPKAMIVRSYQQAYRQDLGVIRVAYTRIEAKAGPCGIWPDNLGSGVIGYSEPWPLPDSENRPYWNFGCATQRNLASSVANPEDLVQPRAETQAYASRRSTVVDKYSKGTDPSTTYSSSSNGKVSTVGP
jgi:pilus assembly protein CpaD